MCILNQNTKTLLVISYFLFPYTLYLAPYNVVSPLCVEPIRITMTALYTRRVQTVVYSLNSLVINIRYSIISKISVRSTRDTLHTYTGKTHGSNPSATTNDIINLVTDSFAQPRVKIKSLLRAVIILFLFPFDLIGMPIYTRMHF